LGSKSRRVLRKGAKTTVRINSEIKKKKRSEAAEKITRKGKTRARESRSETQFNTFLSPDC